MLAKLHNTAILTLILSSGDGSRLTHYTAPESELAISISHEMRNKMLKNKKVAPPKVFKATRPKKSDYQHVSSPDDLARMLIAYFAAYAAEAGLKYPRKAGMVSSMQMRMIVITWWTAFRISGKMFSTRHYVWGLDMVMFLGVDEAGNGFSFGSEGIATHLSFNTLRKMPVKELKRMLDSCDPFADHY